MPDIVFQALDSYAKIYDAPVPAKNCLPEWYLNQNMYVDNIKGFDHENYTNHTLRACMPVFDSLTAGYIIKLPCDIIVNSKNNILEFS